MTRYSWYAVSWPITMRELASRLNTISLTEDASDGFAVERARDTFVEAAYYRRVAASTVRVDPFGGTGELSFSYTLCRFLASTESLGLELIDAPRGNQTFVSRLLEICDFRLTILPLKVNVEEWAERIMDSLGAPAQVDILQAGSIELKGGSIARVTVRGTGDVRQAAKDFVSQSSVVEKMQIRLRGPYEGTSIVLSQGGAAKIQGRLEIEVRDAARRSLLTFLVNG